MKITTFNISRKTKLLKISENFEDGKYHVMIALHRKNMDCNVHLQIEYLYLNERDFIFHFHKNFDFTKEGINDLMIEFASTKVYNCLYKLLRTKECKVMIGE